MNDEQTMQLENLIKQRTYAIKELIDMANEAIDNEIGIPNRFMFSTEGVQIGFNQEYPYRDITDITVQTDYDAAFSTTGDWLSKENSEYTWRNKDMKYFLDNFEHFYNDFKVWMLRSKGVEVATV